MPRLWSLKAYLAVVNCLHRPSPRQNGSLNYMLFTFLARDDPLAWTVTGLANLSFLMFICTTRCKCTLHINSSHGGSSSSPSIRVMKIPTFVVMGGYDGKFHFVLDFLRSRVYLPCLHLSRRSHVYCYEDPRINRTTPPAIASI